MENYKQIKTYEDALRVLGKEDFSRENLYPREIARRKLEIIIEALNEGWEPNLSNHQEYRWYYYFNRSLTSLGYSNSNNSPTPATTTFRVRLYLKDKKLADYIGKQFKNLYEEMLLG